MAKYTIALSCIILPAIISAVTVTQQQVNNVEILCSDLITTSLIPTVGAKLVRLAFHDCVGGCDGCINVNNPDNNGLGDLVAELEVIYDGEIDGQMEMSRADFWALCAKVALDRAVRGNTPTNERANITVNYGRPDCNADSPFTNVNHTFPSPKVGWQATMDFFSDNFGLTNSQTTALLGAHTMGGASPANSGYGGGRWDDTANRFDNRFYQVLRDFTWNQESRGRRANTKWQWRPVEDTGLFMLNADVCLLKNIAPEPDVENLPRRGIQTGGRVTDDLDITPDSDTADLVNSYAANNVLWVADFRVAFNLMIERGSAGQMALDAPVDE